MLEDPVMFRWRANFRVVVELRDVLVAAVVLLPSETTASSRNNKDLEANIANGTDRCYSENFSRHLMISKGQRACVTTKIGSISEFPCHYMYL